MFRLLFYFISATLPPPMSLEAEIKYRPQWRKTCWWELHWNWFPPLHQNLTKLWSWLLKVIYWEVFFSENFTSSLTVLVSGFIFCILAWKRMPFFFHSILCLGIETEFWGGVKTARDFPGTVVVKNSPASPGDARHLGSVLGSRRSPGEGHGNPLQYSCLENPMDGGAW